MINVPVVLPCIEYRYNEKYSVMVILRNGVWQCFGMKHCSDGCETAYQYMFGLMEKHMKDIREAIETACANVEGYDDIIAGEGDE